MFWSSRYFRLMLFLVCCTAVLTGCNPQKPVYFRGAGDLSQYMERSIDIEYPDVDTAPLDEVTRAHAPLTVENTRFDAFWDLSLEEVLSTALQNNKVIRGYGTPGLQDNRVAPGVDNLANGTNQAGTMYNIGIRQSEPGIIGTPGQITPMGTLPTNTALDVNQGVEAALAEFDAQLTSNLLWNTTDRPRNANLSSNNNFFTQSDWSWTTQLAKKTATGSQFFLRNTNGYTRNNLPPALQALSSVYSMSLEAEWRQPLLRGRGASINRMPVIFARIGTDQELANLEAQLQNMVCNVEIRYWELYAAYRSFQSAKEARDAAITVWRRIKERLIVKDSSKAEEAQAREQLYFFDGEVTRSHSSLVNAENNLRWLMGIAMTDGRLIRPKDEPTEASIDFDWCNSLDEALSFRPTLRMERWELKKRQLAIAHSKNGLLPNLNMTALYRFVGLGDDFGASNAPGARFPGVGSDAWDSLTSGDFQEVSFGLEFGMPVGYRRELANVVNARLKLARQSARVEDAELDVSRELTQALRAVRTNYQLAKTQFNRWVAATAEVEAAMTSYTEGKTSLDTVLDAQRRRSQSHIGYYQSLVEYNKSIALVHRRKGTSLDYCGITFAEGPWTGKAYVDARQHARRRAASKEMSYAFTRPEVVSRGTMPRGGTRSPLDLGTVELQDQYLQDGQYIQQPEITTPVESLPNPIPAMSDKPVAGSVLEQTSGQQPIPSRPDMLRSLIGTRVGQGMKRPASRASIQMNSPRAFANPVRQASAQVEIPNFRAASVPQVQQKVVRPSNVRSETFRPKRKTVARLKFK